MKHLLILIAMLFSTSLFAANVDIVQLEKDSKEFHEAVLQWRAEEAQIEGKRDLLKAAQEQFEKDKQNFENSKTELSHLVAHADEAARLNERGIQIQRREVALAVLVRLHEQTGKDLRAELVRLTKLAVQAKDETPQQPQGLDSKK